MILQLLSGRSNDFSWENVSGLRFLRALGVVSVSLAIVRVLRFVLRLLLHRGGHVLRCTGSHVLVEFVV